MTCDFVGRGGGWKDLGVGEKGGGNSLVIKNKQNRVGGFGF